MAPKADVEVSSPRGYWASQAEFILSTMGYAIGLGNIWRFPYLCMRNGGGAFLLPYMTLLLLCGIPMFYLEVIIGQFSGLGSIKVWKMCPIFSGIGWGMVISSFLISIKDHILFGWVIYYLVKAFSWEVPWQSCQNSWNTISCQSVLDTQLNSTAGWNQSLVLADQSYKINNTRLEIEHRTAAEEFFLYKVLNISSGITAIGGIQWHLAGCLFVAVLMSFLALCKGIQSSGKVAYVTVLSPYVLITVLLIRGVTLPGSLHGIKYYIIPDWSKLLEYKVWIEACFQVFYTLGIAVGGITTLSSYNRFHNKCLRDCLIVCTTNAATSFYAGFAIFSIIGFMSHSVDKPIENVIQQGPGLALVAYPEALTHLPFPPIWAICFFLVLITLGIDTQFGMLETVITSLTDVFPQTLRPRKTLFVAAVCVLIFLLGLPFTTRGGMYLFQLCDWYLGQFNILVVALIEMLLVSYCYGIGRFYTDLSLMTRGRPSRVWAVCWCGVVPCLLLLMLVITGVHFQPLRYGDNIFPGWADSVGWAISMLALLPIPLVAVYEAVRAEGTIKQRFTHLLSPAKDWLPQQAEYHSKYSNVHSGTTWRQRLSLKVVLSEGHVSHGDVPETMALNDA